MAATPRSVGARIKRREDPRLIRGLAKFTDDLKLHHALHAVFVRSDVAAGRIRNIHTADALALPGVRAVVTAADLRDRIGSTPPVVTPEGMNRVDHPLLADRHVRYAGHPIAVVIADDLYQARDGASAVQVDIDPLPAIVDAEQALHPEAPRVYEELADNVCQTMTISSGDVDGLFKSAAGTVSLRVRHPRLAPTSLEGRAAAAQWDEGAQKLTLWSSTQKPHLIKQEIAACLRLPEIRVRVVAPEVGGGFGSKTSAYPEECLVGWLARKLGRPIRWMASRSENTLCTTHGRAHVSHVEAAYDTQGRILALRGKWIQNVGAFCSSGMGTGLFPGLYLGGATGCYAIEAAEWEYVGVYTHTMAIDAYRGVGRVEPNTVVERLMDVVARKLDLDPAEIRRHNFIPADAFPYPTPGGFEYDSGNYEATLDLALERFDYRGARAAQQSARSDGRLVGIGIAASTEVCSFGPSAGTNPAVFSGWWESAVVRVEPSGNVVILTGLSPHGQGTETIFAQMVADRLGIDLDSVVVVHGDTDAVPHGVGTDGSRGASVGGTALHMALTKVEQKAARIAAHHLDTTTDHVEFKDGIFHVVGSDRALTFREVARAAHVWSVPIPDEEPGLEALAVFEPTGLTFPNSVHLSQVEIDRDTGSVTLQRYVAVDDCGVQLNPLLVDGQRLGGIAQGLGGACAEEMRYDESGQPETANLAHYALPRAGWLPRIELASTCTPTPVNPLGAKGVGEAGTITAPACYVNAVLDALVPLGVTHLDMPLTSERVWRAIQDAANGSED